MSKIALVSPASGTATFNITVPGGTSTNRTLTLPDSAGDVVVTQATQSLTNKSFDSAPVPTVSGTAPLYMARAWVNFNGTTSPGTIRASGNVSSVTKNGTGDYTVNFATAMPDVNYAVTGMVGTNGTSAPVNVDAVTSGAFTASSSRVFVRSTSAFDPVQATIAIFR